MQLILHLFFYGIIYECLFEVVFNNLPCIPCSWKKFGSFLNILQPLGLHSCPSFGFVSFHEGEEVRRFLDRVPGDTCISIEGHELTKVHEEVICVISFSIKFIGQVSFKSSPFWLIHSSIQVCHTKGIVSCPLWPFSFGR